MGKRRKRKDPDPFSEVNNFYHQLEKEMRDFRKSIERDRKALKRDVERSQIASFGRKKTQKKRTQSKSRSQKTKVGKISRTKRLDKSAQSNSLYFDELDTGLDNIDLSEFSPLQKLVFLIILVVGFTYVFWDTPVVQNAIRTLVTASLVGVSVALVGGIIYFAYSKKKEKLNERDVRVTLEESEIMDYYNQVIEEIKEFRPVKYYQNERSYQNELYQWLKAKFQDVKIEEQRGSSRPDIVVGDIAIEVKGPTGFKELQSIADKLLRYSRHFNHVIVVLFDVTVNPTRYDEWVNGLRERFPEVTVIRKDRFV
ncbi:hypothetical protein [Geoglobus acetivorans]|uniref:Uncharacterized protein n=1 Tax=Geoglobus acetivorans TaxID=565033 RepID=A0ABZ3H5R5_GEOAI|nr:hypothetical protein [Geoglobus acetivorans]